MLTGTANEKKVAVAKDVISELNTRRYIAKQGCYVCISETVTKIDWISSIQSNWDNIIHCGVCAVGACLLSIIKFNNSLKFCELPTKGTDFNTKSIALLAEVFRGNELAFIEAAFEETYNNISCNIGRNYMVGGLTDEQADKARNFFRSRYVTRLNEYDKLRILMEYIITNNGNIL